MSLGGKKIMFYQTLELQGETPQNPLFEDSTEY